MTFSRVPELCSDLGHLQRTDDDVAFKIVKRVE